MAQTTKAGVMVQTNSKGVVSFDSFMIADSDLNLGDLRQLAVDNYLVLPINTTFSSCAIG